MSPDTLLEIGWKTVALCAGVLALLRCVASQSAGKRAVIGHGGVIAALLIVPLSVWGPTWTFEVASKEPTPVYDVPPIAARTGPTPIPVGQPGAPASSPAVTGWDGVDFPMIATSLYLAIVGLLLLRMALSVWKATALGRRSLPVENPLWVHVLAEQKAMARIGRRVKLRVSPDIDAPVSFGLWRPVIVLDLKTFQTQASARAVMGHELAHIANHDWCKLILCRVAAAALWFNPMIWALGRACSQLREEAADDVVLRREIRSDDYAELLVDVASRQPLRAVPLAIGLASRNNALRQRLVRILAERMDRAPAGAALTTACLACVTLAAPFAAFTPIVAERTIEPVAHKSTKASTVGLIAQPPAPGASALSKAPSNATPSQSPAPAGTPFEGEMPLPSSFSAIKFYGWGDIRLRYGPKPTMRVVEGSAKETHIEVDDAGVVSVMACAGACRQPKLVLEVTTPVVPSLAVTGGGAITAQRGFPAQAAIQASVMGGGVVDLGAVKTSAGRVDITSGGSVVTDRKAELVTNIMDGGSVVRRDP